MARNEFGYLGNARNDGLSFGDPGTESDDEQRWCGVCGTECVVERNVNGPTSLAAAWAGHKRLHDVFRCPHYGSEWHTVAIKLIHEMRDTASGRLRALIEADLDELVAGNLPNGKCSKCGLKFDIGCEQTCPGCGNRECAAYKPWIMGCNSQEPCPHRSTCEWAGKP